MVAFTPKGGCPLKQGTGHIPKHLVQFVAFTPKGGCPLKLPARGVENTKLISSSIHPQGWVPIETMSRTISADSTNKVAFTPKGGCPLKQLRIERDEWRDKADE